MGTTIVKSRNTENNLCIKVDHIKGQMDFKEHDAQTITT